VLAWAGRLFRVRAGKRTRRWRSYLGATGGWGAGDALPLFLPTPSFMASADEE